MIRNKTRNDLKTGLKWALVMILALSVGYRLFLRAPRGEPWERWASPEAAGYSAAGLEAALKEVRRLGTTGLMVIKGGKVLLEFGKLEARGYMAAGRYSIAAMVFGKPDRLRNVGWRTGAHEWIARRCRERRSRGKHATYWHLQPTPASTRVGAPDGTICW